MSDKDKTEISEANSQKGKLSVIKIEARKKLKNLMGDSSDWEIPEQIIQEIIATKSILNGSEPTNPELVEAYYIYIKQKYGEEEEIYNLLVECAPSVKALPAWKKKTGWDDAVWKYLKDTNLFSRENRASMIRALYNRGLEKDTVAAKIWLTLSGDYSDKMEVKSDDTVDKFRKINEILHRKS